MKIKKAFRSISIIMILCLVLSSVAFATQEEEPVTDETKTEATEEISLNEEVVPEGDSLPVTEATEEESAEKEPAEEENAGTESMETEEDAIEAPVFIEIPAAEDGQGISGDMIPAGEEVFAVVPGEKHMEEPVWTDTDGTETGRSDLNENWIKINDNLGVSGDIVTLEDIPWSDGAYSEQGAESEDGIDKLPQLCTSKEIPLVVLVVGFTNINYTTNYNWYSAVFSASDSLAKYYTAQSFGKFTFVPARETSRYGYGGNTNTADAQNDGVVHVKINLPHEDWTLDNSVLGYVPSLISETKAIKAAVLASDPYVDYSQFDADNDGLIENNEMGLAVVMAGYEGAYDTSKPLGSQYYLWSHAWGLSGGTYYDSSFTLPKPDGVTVDSFITIPEKLEANTQEHIGVLAHELGHYLGLPDLYNTEGSSGTWKGYNVADVSVMAGGVWCWNGSKYVPSSFDAWSRCVLGWVRPTLVRSGQYTVQSTQGNYNVLMVQTSNNNEYYLIENRQYSGWDIGLSNSYSSNAPSGGLVFWHIDDAVYNEYGALNGISHRPGVMPLYPETTNGYTTGTYTFIGKLPDNWCYRPFYNSSIASTVTNGSGTINLPMYNGSNTPSDRRNSGINVKVLTGSGTSMTVQFSNVPDSAYVDRIAGANRYKTAFEALNYYRNTKGTGIFGNIVIASGKDYADALAGSYLAIRNAAPILLVNDNNVNEVASYVSTNMASGGTVYILGGTGAVSSKMETALKNAGINSANINRLAGANRYETNVKILQQCGVKGKDLLICSGKGYADALSASSVSKPILLTNNKALTEVQVDFLDYYGPYIRNAYCIGGDGVVSNSMAWNIYHYMDPSFDPYNDSPSNARIYRVSGADRYKTSVRVAEVFFSPSRIFLAYALNYPDGLSGGPVANYVGAPVILATNKKADDARNYATGNGIRECTVMGGKSLISDETAYYILGR